MVKSGAGRRSLTADHTDHADSLF